MQTQFMCIGGTGWVKAAGGNFRQISFRLVLSLGDLQGGGMLYGDEEILRAAATSVDAELMCATGQRLAAVLGGYDDSRVPVAILGCIAGELEEPDAGTAQSG